MQSEFVRPRVLVSQPPGGLLSTVSTREGVVVLVAGAEASDVGIGGLSERHGGKR